MFYVLSAKFSVCLPFSVIYFILLRRLHWILSYPISCTFECTNKPIGMHNTFTRTRRCIFTLEEAGLLPSENIESIWIRKKPWRIHSILLNLLGNPLIKKRILTHLQSLVIKLITYKRYSQTISYFPQTQHPFPNYR